MCLNMDIHSVMIFLCPSIVHHVSASLTSERHGADVLLDLLALGRCGGGRGQLRVDVVGDGRDRCSEVRRAVQVTGGQLGGEQKRRRDDAFTG